MTTQTITERIDAYMSGGGLFNPEMANHDAVRDLLRDARGYVVSLERSDIRLAEILQHWDEVADQFDDAGNLQGDGKWRIDQICKAIRKISDIIERQRTEASTQPL